MPSLSTLEAHFEATLAYTWQILLLALFDVAQATRLRAPPELWVQIDNDVFMKAEILRINLLRTEFADVFPLICEWTSSFHAFDLQYLPFGHIDSQMVSDAVLALSVSALEPKHILFFI